MRRPNGSGSLIKMSGKRRRPYAVRIFDGVEIKPNGNATPKYKYLGYFEKQTDALQFLEKYNSSPVTIAKPKQEINKHKFSEIYDLYINELKMAKDLSHQSYRSRLSSYNQLKPLHNMVFENITLDDLEKEVRKHSDKSKSTVANLRVLLKGMYKTAMRHKYVNEDLSALLLTSHSNESKTQHVPFTDEEIDMFWQHSDEYFAKMYLILIYTGMRVKELLELKSENVHLDEKYLIGGMKTEAGKNRTIPLSDKIIPLFDLSNEYVISLKGHSICYRTACLYAEDLFEMMGMQKHLFHDARHTCASLLERAGVEMLHRKLILGHKISDITEHYTHVPLNDLIADINKI